jgi:NADPH2:quinone reductase
MKAIRFHELGGPEVLRLEEVPDPTPGPGELLLKVAAAGLNFSDIAKRTGRYLEPTPLPFTPGSEVAGTVVAVGAGVTRFAVGDSATGILPDRSGGYAELAVLPEAQAVGIPNGLSATLAVAVPNQGATAISLLTLMARLAPGESVLVSAAAGGVGGWIVSLARALGAGRIIALASSDAKRAETLRLGADVSLDPADPDWPAQARAATGGRGVDVFPDSVGGAVFRGGLAALAPFGRAVVYGLASGERVDVAPVTLMRPCQTVGGFHLDAVMADPPRMRAILDDLFARVARGEVSPRIDRVFPLTQAVEAQAWLASRKAMGKIVLTP